MGSIISITLKKQNLWDLNLTPSGRQSVMVNSCLWKWQGCTRFERQVTYDIMVNEQRICKYIADFVYTLIHEDGKKEKIVEDAKGVQTTDFVIKKKLMKAVFDIEIKISKKVLDLLWEIPILKIPNQ